MDVKFMEMIIVYLLIKEFIMPAKMTGILNILIRKSQLNL